METKLITIEQSQALMKAIVEVLPEGVAFSMVIFPENVAEQAGKGKSTDCGFMSSVQPPLSLEAIVRFADFIVSQNITEGLRS